MPTVPSQLDARRHLVAAFVAFHLVAMVVASFPAPVPAVTRGTPEEVRDLLAPWVSAAEAVGVPPGEAEPLVRSVASGWARAVRGAHAVLQPYTRTFGVLQGWTMFGHITTESALPCIDVRRAGTWEPLYAARSSEADWRRSLFDHDRTRTWLHEAGWKSKRKTWGSFADWVAREVPKDLDGVEEIRVEFVPVHIPDPAELRETRQLVAGAPQRVETRVP